jgi:hypothetical protein
MEVPMTGEAHEATTCFTLGFTSDDVVGGWQHWRLGMECGRAFEAEGLPASFGILEAPGEGRHILYWFVSRRAAQLLDRHDVPWRRFLVRTDLKAPPAAHPALTGRP